MMRVFGLATIADELPALQRYARTLTRDETAAEDLVHDTLLRAYDKRHSFRRGASLRPWLFAILHNLFVTGWRRSAAEHARIERAAETALGESPPNQEHALRLRLVEQAFEELSDDHRTALHLVVIEGLPYQEAADALGVPMGTLISRLSRARTALRERERLPQRAPVQLRIVGGSHD